MLRSVVSLVVGLLLAVGLLLTVGIASGAVQSITLSPGDSLDVDCSSELSGTFGAHSVHLDCAPDSTGTPSPEPTGTPLPPLTETPVPVTETPTTTSEHTPIATETQTPTSLTPTVTPAPTGTPSTTIAACPHNEHQWHALVERNTDGSIRCTYGHFHGDDPKSLDHVFGPLPAYLGGEISYPFETTHENLNKHNVYKWSVVDVVECKPSNAGLGFKRIRAQFHADGTLGASVRRHSYWLQAEACDPNDPNYSAFVEIGGHMDYGFLSLAGIGYVGSPNDDLDRSVVGGLRDDIRGDGSPGTFKGDSTWYGSTRYVGTDPYGIAHLPIRVGIIKEAWGYVDPQTLAITNYPANSRHVYRGAWIEPVHLLDITWGGLRIAALDGTPDGHIDYTGHTDRFGRVVPAGCAIGPDCVPLVIRGFREGQQHQFRAGANGLPARNYDVKDPATGQSLIQYPN